MTTLRKIQLDCRRATSLIEKRQYTRLSLKERLHLAIHLAGCGVCRLFQKQSRWINALIRNLLHGSSTTADTNKLDEKFKQELQEKINERMP